MGVCPLTIIVLFNVGSGWTGQFTGLADALAYADSSVDVVYDFEPKTLAKGDCKDDGWQSLTDDQDRPFVNQGDCVSYFASNGKTRGPK